MKSTLIALGVVAGFLATVGIVIVVLFAWVTGCNWLMQHGHSTLGVALFPISFILYGMLIAIFLIVREEAKNG